MSKDKNLLRASISVDQTRYRKDDFAIILCSIYELKENSAEPQYSSYNQVTIKGTMPSLKEDGTLYNIVAEYVHDEKYGDQYNLVSIVPSIEFGENDPKGKKQFLLSIFTELQVQEMYEALDDPFTALKENNAAELVKIKGCGMKNAAIWSDKFNRNLGMAKIFTELEDYELSNNMIEKLIDKYKSPELVIEKVKNNPYILATEVKGIGFKKADKIALAGGLDEYGPERIGAFIVYYLEECGENGLSWIESDHLCGAILDALGEEVPDINISLAIQSLGEKLWWSEDKERIGLRRYYDIEHKIAEELIRLRDAESHIKYDNWKDKVSALEKRQGWEYTEEQLDGIQTGLYNNVTVITGLSGTGKTSVVKGILTSLPNCDFVQVALSGRAASRLTEVTGKEGATIHRTLGYPLGDKQGFVYHDEKPLPYDLYILDEISMVDSFLLYYLLRAIPSGSKVYLLGDVGQLESIGAGNIAHDIIDSGEIATVFLTKIHRQAAKSAIVTESIKVRNSQQLVDKDWVGTETRGELQDLTIKCFSDKSNTYHEVIRTFKHYFEADNFNIMETQIIVPIKSRGDANTRKLNNAIQEIYNPDPMNHKMSYQIYKDGATYTLREGDKVINKVNNYKTNPFIYNGNMGILERIAYDEDMDDEVMVINFKAIGQVKVPKKYWKNIELAYAITVHSDQGSEHDNIIFGLDFASYSLLSKELVYTGITRARKKCELIAQTGALRMAIATEGVSKKQTHLIECIQEVAHPKLTF